MTALRLSGLAAASFFVGLLAAPAWGQRVQFPTPVADSTPPPPAAPDIGRSTTTPAWDPYANRGLPASGGAPTYTPAPYSAAPTYTPAPSGGAPTYTPAPSSGAPSYTPAPPTYTPPPYNAAPTYTPAPPSYTPAPYSGAPTYTPAPQYAVPAPYAASPSAVPQPYYPANPATPGYLYPNGGPSLAPGCGCGVPYLAGGPTFTRFLQEIRLDETFVYGEGERRVETNDIETSATFALPVYWSNAPFLITPGFGLHTWERGPQTEQLPAQTYDAFLDAAWNPQPSPYFGAELGVRVGVYSDFDTFTDHSIRIMGRALGVLNYSPTTEFKLGAIYMDRIRIKLLPAFGLFWTPDPDTRWEIFFPRPKYEHHFLTTATYQWWWYVVGEYGGGSWTFRRDIPGPSNPLTHIPTHIVEDQFDYNDIRVAIGIEWVPECHAGLRGYIEAGFATDREIVYRLYPPSNIDLPNTFLIRGGIAY